MSHITVLKGQLQLRNASAGSAQPITGDITTEGTCQQKVLLMSPSSWDQYYAKSVQLLLYNISTWGQWPSNMYNTHLSFVYYARTAPPCSYTNRSTTSYHRGNSSSGSIILMDGPLSLVITPAHPTVKHFVNKENNLFKSSFYNATETWKQCNHGDVL